MKNASHEFIFHKLIAQIILGLGNNLASGEHECQDIATRGKKLFSVVEFFLMIDIQR